MNMFVHGALRHFLMAEGDAPAGGGGSMLGDTPAAPAPTAPATPPTTADTLADINADTTKTVGQLEAEQAAKDAANAETPEQKATREAAEKAKANEVPEKYADFKLPEGVQADPAMLAEFNTVAKELGLTQDQAQKLVDLQAKTSLADDTARNQLLDKALETQRNQWADQIKNDPDVGGAKFEATLATAQKAMQAFGSTELRQLLNESGIGNHPDMVKLFHKIGSAISEDRMVIPGSDAAETDNKRAADVMFGDVKFT